MEEGFLLMNLSNTKTGEHIEWLRKNNQKENRLIMCLHATEKYEKVESVNTQNDYETASKNWTDKKETDLLAQVTLPDS